ncbi:dipeptidyl peptidase 3 [Alistipes sp. OttesenSCG-928-B03]|nr:dipeptidyl peptidase 3 [Alistipes sp. OttesenSCG-928-B03]
MKKIFYLTAMCALMTGLTGCPSSEQQQIEKTEEFEWIADKFDDIKILRYQVPDFDKLTLDEKLLVYYLSESALCGRDILFDQNCRYNLPVRRTLEAIYAGYAGERSGEQWEAFEKYLKKVWFANGIHHHYSNDKFTPEFTAEYFDTLIAATPDANLPTDYGTVEELLAMVQSLIFDPEVMPLRVNQADGVDMLQTSAMNYYEGVTQKEAENFYRRMAAANDPQPVSYGLNSKLVKEDGQLVEKVWHVGGMYSSAIERIVYWLEKASEVANPTQKTYIDKLISYYRTGDLRTFDEFNILWVKDTVSTVDFVNGFTEIYGDPLGYKASWESLVNFRNVEATKRTSIISDNAQWFEDHSPIDDKYKKEQVKGVSAKVITAAMLGGDCYPATPIGINLPNADWIRAEHGSKSVTIENISDAYDQAAKGNGFLQEFVLRAEDRERIEKHGSMAGNLHTDLHECLGHGSGKLAPGTRGDELRNYGSVLEEARADLFALYYIADPKMIEIGLIPTLDVAWAEYASYINNGMLTQLTRIQPGKNVEQAHMRNRKLVGEWCYEQGLAENVIEKVVQDGKTYVVVNDFDKLRELFGRLLREIQRIKSEGDYNAGRKLVETYAITVDPVLHAEVLDRSARLGIQPYSGFLNPEYSPVMDNGQIVDVKVSYPDNYVNQMLDYSKKYSYLPSKN